LFSEEFLFVLVCNVFSRFANDMSLLHTFRLLPWLLLTLLLLTDCTRKGISQKSAGERQDTLSTLRPQYNYQKQIFEGESRYIGPQRQSDSSAVFRFDITRRLNSILDYVAKEEIIKITRNGYRILIYIGTDAEEAKRLRQRSYAIFPELTPHTTFSRPNYRVKIGDFEYREDAMAIFRQVKAKFAQATIVPDEVEVMRPATPDELIELQRRELEKERDKKKKNN